MLTTPTNNNMAFCPQVHHLQSLSFARTHLYVTRLFYSSRPWTLASIHVESQRMTERQCKTLCCRNFSLFHHYQLYGSASHVMARHQYDVSSTTNHCRFIHASIEHLSPEQSQNVHKFVCVCYCNVWSIVTIHLVYSPVQLL